MPSPISCQLNASDIDCHFILSSHPAQLIQMTGFDLRTFCNNLEKLISWVGDRVEITIKDVGSVLQRTKRDPIYELTNAISDRNVQRTLFYLTSILSADFAKLGEECDKVLAAGADIIQAEADAMATQG